MVLSWDSQTKLSWLKAVDDSCDHQEDCWIWNGPMDKRGYGRIRLLEGWILIHRFTYMLAHEHFPQGAIVQHTCRNSLCCNPDHLILTDKHHIPIE